LNSEERSQQAIHEKGFDIYNTSFGYNNPNNTTNYRNIKVGVKKLEDAVLDLGSYQTSMPKHLRIDK
jgi:hypothetical protein